MKSSSLGQIQSFKLPATTATSLLLLYTTDLGKEFSLHEHMKAISEGRMLYYDRTSIKPEKYIQNLIVTTKAHETLDSILPILPLLNKDTTLVFVQNGAGAVELLFETYFSKLPTEQVPANIFQGIINHGVYRVKPNGYEFVHTSQNTGELKLGRFSGSTGSEMPSIIDALLATDLGVSMSELALKFQMIYLEKLIVNSVVNPLTVLYECRNGDLLRASRIRPLITRILVENVNILKKAYFTDSNHSAADMSYVEAVLDVERLMGVVVKTLSVTDKNYSSMLQDYRSGKPLDEIFYLNGYFRKLAPSNLIVNRMMIDLVKNKEDLRDYGEGFARS